ncbi:hypothetical protein PspTeo4_18704 [Pseudomonas sp. Teo4]|nr:hypothetical protein [Pseudomonas sp. Teo4]
MTKPISLNDTDGMLQLCAQLNPGSTGPYNSDSEGVRCIFSMRTHIACEKLFLKLFCLDTAIQELAMFLNTHSAKIIALATNSHNKRIVRYFPQVSAGGLEHHYFPHTIQTHHATILK